MLNKNSPVPLYYQIAEYLQEQIVAGNLASGTRLTSERELSEQFGVSRMTVRQAINYLQNMGLVDVQQGVGTFVARPKHTYDAGHLVGFSEETSRRGDRVESIVLEQACVRPPARVAELLRLAAGTMAVKVMRLRKVNDEPVLLETSFLPAALCPGLELADLATHSLYALLESSYGLRLQYTQQTMEYVRANEYEERVFELRAGAAMILLEGVTYGEQDLPVEFFRAVYRADRCKFRLESRRSTSGPGSNDDQRISVIVG
jgi:GntR family transcriptional regulator